MKEPVMRKFALLAAAAAAIGFSVVSALPSAAETRSYDLRGFSRIDASAGVNVVLRQGPHSVAVDQENGEFDKLVVEVRGETLKLGRKSGVFNSGRIGRTTITVSAPDVAAIDISSGASLDSDGFRFAGLSLDASSGASVDLAGSCRRLSVDASSGASVQAAGLTCEDVAASASSGASIAASASASAAGDASSGGSIRFAGSPAAFTSDTSSGGSVRRS